MKAREKRRERQGSRRFFLIASVPDYAFHRPWRSQ